MTGADLSIPVRVRPRAGQTRIDGQYPGPFGPALLILVAEPAAEGRATHAARIALARALGVPAVTVSLHTGARSRDKLFRIANAPAAAVARLRALLAEAPQLD